jgi:hypothetical protein
MPGGGKPPIGTNFTDPRIFQNLEFKDIAKIQRREKAFQIVVSVGTAFSHPQMQVDLTGGRNLQAARHKTKGYSKKPVCKA